MRLTHMSYSLPLWLAYWAIGDYHSSIVFHSFELTMTRLAGYLHKLL